MYILYQKCSYIKNSKIFKFSNKRNKVDKLYKIWSIAIKYDYLKNFSLENVSNLTVI